MIKPTLHFCLFSTGLIVAGYSLADGPIVDKVYHPYVLPIERELEWRLTSPDKFGADVLAQRFGFGYSVSENIATEGYLNARRDNNGKFSLQSFEIETRWMVTEQGRYWADFGMLFELEKGYQRNNWKASTAMLVEKEFGRTSLTMNLFAIYRWGEGIQKDFESEFRLNYRYRWLPQIQPAVELYMGEDYAGIGPAFMGLQRFDKQKQLKWEAAFITNVKKGNTDETFRLALEYEF